MTFRVLDLSAPNYEKPVRFGHRAIKPGEVKSRQLGPEILKNSVYTTSSFSSNTATTTTLTTLVTGSEVNVRLGSVPFGVLFFQTSIAAANLIPGGSAITVNAYTVEGPLLVPPSLTGLGPTAGDNDGNNLLFKTFLTNNSGSTQTIFYAVQLRFMSQEGAGEV